MSSVGRISLVLALLIGLIGSPSALAQKQPAKRYSTRLRRHYADFALIPDRSMVAAVNAEWNRIDFIRIDFAGDTGPRDLPIGAEVTDIIGDFPCAILHREVKHPNLGKQPSLIVGSNKTDSLYISSSLGLKQQIAAKGLIRLASSFDVADPFVYYTIGGEVFNSVGAFNLETNRDVGIIIEECIGFDVSRDGKYGYIRHEDATEAVSIVWSAEGKPTLTPIFRREQQPQGEFATDVFGKFVWSGASLFTPDLKDVKSVLQVAPAISLREKPFLIGIRQSSADTATGGPAIATLEAMSISNFKPAGKAIPLLERDVITKGRDGAEVAPHPTEPPEQTDTPLVGVGANWKRSRMFADEVNQQIVYCESNRLHLIPFEMFQLPEEFRLAAKVEGATELKIDKENRINIALPDSDAQVEFEGLPNGMKQEGTALVWSPNEEQLGQRTINYTVKSGAESRAQSLQLDIVRPHVKLPFKPGDFAVDSSSQYAFFWGQPPVSSNGTSTETPTKRVAVMDLKTGKIIEDKELDFPIRTASIGSGHIAISRRSQEANTPNCQLLSINGLKLKKQLLTEWHGTPMRLGDGKMFFRRKEDQAAIFDFDNLNKPKVLPHCMQASGFHPLENEGWYYQGVLYGQDGKPNLIVGVPSYCAIGGNLSVDADPARNGVPVRDFQKAADEFFSLGMLRSAPEVDPNPSNPRRYGTVRIANLKIPGRDTRAMLDIAAKGKDPVTVTLKFAGAKERSILIARDSKLSESEITTPIPVTRLQVNGQHAFVLHGDRLYRTTVPSPQKEEDVDLVPLSFAYEQTEILLSKRAKTELKHRVIGGRAPVTFSLSAEHDALSIDSETGTVTVDHDKALAAIKTQLEDAAKRARRTPEKYMSELKIIGLTEALTEWTGKKPPEKPASIFIAVTATDDALRSANILYEVFIDADLK